jgi:[ribosomal protein S18]-alanine N-acetyltransferase
VNRKDGSLEIRRLIPTLSVPLLGLLKTIAAQSDARFFAPHPFTAECLDSLSAAPGLDLYHVLMVGDDALAYGLLRGWNEGYQVPSLGIAVSPEARGRGLGGLMMEFLHAAARYRGADRVRLRVHRDNQKAIALYRRVGYAFESPDPADGLVVGWKDLGHR